VPERKNDLADREIVMERVHHAPRALVFRAWTCVEHLVHWWGPDGFRTTYHEMDVREGGVARFVMHGPDGTDYPNKMWFHEVRRPEKLVFDHGDFERPWFKVTVTFEDLGGKTRMVSRMLFATVEEREATEKYGAIEGGRQTHARLARYLADLAVPHVEMTP
jgi:uncharacterized protein YndB with AHSA1/START domain